MEKQAAIDFLLRKKNEILTCDPDVWKATLMDHLPNIFPVTGLDKRKRFDAQVLTAYNVDLDVEVYPMWEREQAQGYIQNYIDEIEINGREGAKGQAKTGKIAELIHNEYFYAVVIFVGGLCFFLGTWYERSNH